MRGRAAALGAVLMAVAAIGAGCGEDEPAATTTAAEDGGATGAVGPQSEFAARADEICAAGEREDDATAREAFAGLEDGEEPTPAQLAGYVEAVAPSIQAQIDEVAALEPPQGEEGKARAFVARANAELRALERDPSQLASDANPFAESRQLAQELGITECAAP